MKIGVSFNAISRCTLFEWNWRSIRRLREAFHRELVKSRSDSVCHVEVADIKKYLGAYNSLLENLNSTGSSFKISLNIASLLEFVYHLAVFVYPSVMVELAKSEVQKIKYLVNEIRARHSDPRVSAKADDALQFLSLRPFEFVVWRFMSVNIQLPLNFVVLIVSYVIVTIQFTHIYG
ncbi:unnamed protein product [Leptosia nina]|uniref:Gustatory receptor n=1 Tax=Leptosia nina TaxID=320188 RepID=A0AAV1JWW8_9NEOP